MDEAVAVNVKIIKLVVSYFKSFSGLNSIFPFESLNAVTGANGSGKSNFIDAFAFCFNESLEKLRVDDAAELVHIHASPSEKTFVKCTFLFPDETEKSFTREIVGSSFNYLIDDTRVREREYVEELMNIGINIKNCVVVYQEDMHAITSMKGKKLTDLLERVSGSIAYRVEYQRLNKELEEARLLKKNLFDEKKHLTAAQKSLKEISKSNRISLGIQQEYVIYFRKWILANLQRVNVELQSKELEVNTWRQELRSTKNKIIEKEELILPLKQVIRDSERQILDFERNSSQNASQKVAIEAKCQELEKQIKDDEKKLDAAKRTLQKAQDASTLQEKALKELRDALDVEIAKKEEYLQSSADDLARLKELQEQDGEYHHLKNIVLEKTTKFVRELETLELQRGQFNNSMANLLRQLDDKTNELENQDKLLSKCQNELEVLKDKKIKTENKIENNEKNLEELKSNMENYEKEQKDLLAEINKINGKLQSLKLDKSQAKKAKMEAESLETLQKTFDGVKGRMHQLCKPIHGDRFKVPMAKAFGKYYSAIIVDTAETATKCMQLLFNNRLTFEIFLPLDNLEVPRLKERLRDANSYDGIHNVKLLFDTLQYSDDIRNAVLFAAGNTLVCDTSRDANYVAYDLRSGDKHDCVSLDGTFYKKNGTFSGGRSTVSQIVQLANTQELDNLIKRRQEVIDNLKAVQKNLNSRSELESLETEKSKLTWEKTYLESTIKEKNSMKTELKKSIKKLTAEQADLQRKREEIQEQLDAFNPEFQRIKDQITPIEDEVYQNFCTRLRLNNVSEYPNQLTLWKEKNSALRKIEERIEQLESCIQYESSNTSISNNIDRWREIVKTRGTELDRKRKEKEGLDKACDELKAKELSDEQTLNLMKEELQNSVTQLKQLEIAIKRCKNKEYELSSKLQDPEHNDEFIKADFHDYILKAKTESVDLPVLEDSTDLEYLYEQIESVEPDDCDSQRLKEIYELEGTMRFDYSSIEQDLPKYDNIIQLTKFYRGKLDDLGQKLHSMPTSSTVEVELNESKEKLALNNQRQKENLRIIRRLGHEFEQVKASRYNAFMRCFEAVRVKLGAVYKDVTGCNFAEAFLLPINPEEPYLDEIKFKFVPPNKQNRGPVEASGGEKALATLSLLFSIHGDHHLPLLLLDEIDADLDNHNTKNVIQFLRRAQNNQQIIFVSHNVRVIACADKAFSFWTTVNINRHVRTTYVNIDLKIYN